MKVIDLFCGCGGFTQGFKQNSNFEIVVGIDSWDVAIETYKKNHHHLALCKDLTQFPPEMLVSEYGITDIDCIIGGPPCQGFSIAGKRDINDPRNSLFMEFKKYIDYYNPKIFIMENVMGILTMKNESGQKCIDIILSLLSINYNTLLCKLYASDFNVPQNRRRILIFGVRKDLGFRPFEPIPLYEISERPKVSTILEDKKEIDEKYFLTEKAIQGIKNKKERMIEEGKGFGAQFLDPDKPSYTIPARYWKDGYDALVYYDENSIRRLTILELKRIQTFPDNYHFEGSKKDIIIQIGNAVACNFAFEMSKHLEKIFSPQEVSPSLDKETNFNNLTVSQLKNLCKEKGLIKYSNLRKRELIQLLDFK